MKNFLLSFFRPSLFGNIRTRKMNDVISLFDCELVDCLILNIPGSITHIAFRRRFPDRLDGRLRGVLTQVARPAARYMPGPRWWGRLTGVDGRRISALRPCRA